MIPPLLWASYRRYLGKNLWLPLLCLVAIATGVAVILGVDLANISARASFALSTQALTGRATHSVVGVGRTVPDALYVQLRVEQKIRGSAPVVEGHVRFLQDSGEELTLTLLGVDPFSDGAIRDWTGARGGEQAPRSEGPRMSSLLGSPDRVLASEATARRLDWQVGDPRTAEVGGRPVRLVLGGVLATDAQASAIDGYLLADISTAQSLLRQSGLDRIDLVLSAQQEVALKGWLDPQFVLAQAATSQKIASELSAAFHTSLQALSYLCLLVATFLIFNVVSFSVAHRRQSLGRLRILGVTSSQLGRMILAEALALGALGSALGLPFGVLLGRGLVPLVSRTVNDLYYRQAITDFVLPPSLLFKAAACGLLASLLAAALPAYGVAVTEPLGLMMSVQSWRDSLAMARRTATLGLAVLTLSGLLLLQQSLSAGFASLLGVVLGYSLLIPLALLGLSWLGRSLSRQLSHRMAILGLGIHLPRTATAAVALTVAVAATISIAVMVASFRQTLTVWLANTLRADVYLSARVHENSSELPPQAVAEVLAWPELDHWSAQRVLTVPSETGQTALVGVKVGGDYRQSLRFLKLAPDGWQRFERGQGVFLTEPYARRAGKRVGDSLRLSTPQGERELPVVGVYYSYAPDRNTALIGILGLEEMFGPGGYGGLGLYLGQGSDIADVVSRLKKQFGEAVEIRATREIRSLALDIFERTFTVTEVLRYLALAIAVVGVLLSLWALGEQRKSEVRVLRALGFSQKELFATALMQSYWLGLICGILACPLGALLAKMMISVLNQRAFGWTIDFYPQGWALASALLVAISTAAVAGLIPAYRWSRTAVNEGLRERE